VNVSTAEPPAASHSFEHAPPLASDDRQAILAAWREVLDSGTFVLGPQLGRFEHELAAYIGVDHAIGVSSGTDALALILRATIEPGDEVLVPALSFIATAEAVLHAGGIPVFCDVDPDTWCMTAATAAPHFTEETGAVLPVHLFGNPAPIWELETLGVPVIEDACQAIGSTFHGTMCGALGRAAAFSFYPSKTLAACGDAGAVTTDDADLAERVRRLRHHGSDDGRLHQEVGGTHRLDELQAAVLRVRLAALPQRIADQRVQADQLRTAGHKLQRETFRGESSWHRFVTCESDRSGGGRRYYQPPLHQQPSMRPYWRGELPNAERFARRNECVDLASTTPPA
jgi:dTDP-3-amino-3,4,6-trideoxy-alpha-D-glucose transaminase